MKKKIIKDVKGPKGNVVLPAGTKIQVDKVVGSKVKGYRMDNGHYCTFGREYVDMAEEEALMGKEIGDYEILDVWHEAIGWVFKVKIIKGEHTGKVGPVGWGAIKNK